MEIHLHHAIRSPSMSSRGKNFRRRLQDDNGDDKDMATPSTTTITKKLRSLLKPSSASATIKSVNTTHKNTTPAKKKLLSFAADKDANDFSISHQPSKPPSSSSRFSKPSSFSHKLTAAKDRLPPPTSSFQPQAGIYTKEALLELQKSTKTLTVSSRAPPPIAEPITMQKGLIKPLDSNDNTSHSDSKDEDEKNDTKVVKKDKGSLLLDQATIDAIRAKRERLR